MVLCYGSPSKLIQWRKVFEGYTSQGYSQSEGISAGFNLTYVLILTQTNISYQWVFTEDDKTKPFLQTEFPVVRFQIFSTIPSFPLVLCCLYAGLIIGVTGLEPACHGPSSNTVRGIMNIQTWRILLGIEQGFRKWFRSRERMVYFYLIKIWVLVIYKMLAFSMGILQDPSRNPPERPHSLVCLPGVDWGVEPTLVVGIPIPDLVGSFQMIRCQSPSKLWKLPHVLAFFLPKTAWTLSQGSWTADQWWGGGGADSGGLQKPPLPMFSLIPREKPKRWKQICEGRKQECSFPQGPGLSLSH